MVSVYLNHCMELVMHWTFKQCQCGPCYSISFRVCPHEMFLKTHNCFHSVLIQQKTDKSQTTIWNALQES